MLEERAAFALFPHVANPNPADPGVLDRLHAAALQYASFGITTGHEDFAVSGLFQLLRAAAHAGLLPFDVIAFPIWNVAEAELVGNGPTATYDHHLRLGGAKITLDGSIQGYTAFLSSPYFQASKRERSEPPAKGHDPSVPGRTVVE